ncbi:MAG: hypothetical protein COB53_07415 [Elusimicrobia bacterium]|nr:MAG: hypothetical protein COB53_07415 [Elusimicrobiota bacterium]
MGSVCTEVGNGTDRRGVGFLVTPSKLPPGLLGSAALFWGVEAGLVLWAIPSALFLEAPRFVSKRWSLGREDFNRLSDLCAALFGVMAVISYATLEAPEAILTIFRFGPLTLLPIILGQLFSERGRVDVSAFFLALRRQAKSEGISWELDLGYPFLASLMLGAASGNPTGFQFYGGCTIIVGIALWSIRPRRFLTFRWAGLWLATALIGAGVIETIQVGRVVIYRKLLDSYIARIGPRVDPTRAPTAIGRVGRLQQSDSVFLRVRPAERGGSVPELLSDAAYDIYRNREWAAGRNDFKSVLASEPVGTWDIAENRDEKAAIIVSKSLPKGRGLLSIPYGTHRIGGLPAESFERSRFGALRVNGGPSFSEYRASYWPDGFSEAGPESGDLKLAGEEKVIRRIAQEWGLTKLPPGKAIDAMLAHFSENFHYSIYRKEEAGERPLEEFLTTRRRGHCEYFATTAVLLMRAAGVPARYATGFVVREQDRYEEGFVVRGRHAHAWARAYLNGKWVTVDATPASWWPIENARRSGFRPLLDIFDWMRYRWSAWRWRPVEENKGIAWWVWVLALVAGFIIWRNFRDWRPQSADDSAVFFEELRLGLDSELLTLEAAFAERGDGRRLSESLRRWCNRKAGAAPSADAELWRRIGALHERHRFDPKGLIESERTELGRGAQRLRPEKVSS